MHSSYVYDLQTRSNYLPESRGEDLLDVNFKGNEVALCSKRIRHDTENQKKVTPSETPRKNQRPPGTRGGVGDDNALSNAGGRRGTTGGNSDPVSTEQSRYRYQNFVLVLCCSRRR